MKNTKPVTLSRIAEELNLSPTAISMVLNGKGRQYRISAEVEEKIREKAREMGYRPNRLAQSLRTGRTGTIGLIVGDISNPFFSKIARCIENMASGVDYQVMFSSSDESPEKFRKLIRLFIDKQVDGMIVAPTEHSASAVMDLVRANIPVVLIDRVLDDVPVSSVQIDNKKAAYELTRSLLDRGISKIGYMSVTSSLSNFTNRFSGFRMALEEAGIPYHEDLTFDVDFNKFEESVKDGVRRLLEKDIEAILCASNRLGTQTLIELKEVKADIHEKIRIVSFDNPDEFKLAYFPITCVEQPIAEIGQLSLEILMRKITQPSEIIERIILPAKLIVK